MAEHDARLWPRDRQKSRGDLPVRVVTCRTGDGGEIITLTTSLLDQSLAPAAERAALDHERRDIETACDEARANIYGAGASLCSKPPDIAHYAVRCLIHEAAETSGEDPDRFSLTHAVNVIRRQIINPGAFPRWIRCPLPGEISSRRA